MHDKFAQDSLMIAEKAISRTPSNSDSSNIWMWIAIFEFALILAILFRREFQAKQNPKNKFKKDSMVGEIDFNNIINSSFHSTKLYDSLKVKCHPDLFIGDPKLNKIAQDIFQEITDNKTNHKKLEELKVEAQKKLNITI